MTGPPCQRPILQQSCPEGGLCGRDEGGFFTKYLFQFARILAFCFLGEFCHAVLPLPIPASIYGLVLLLAALLLGFVLGPLLEENLRRAMILSRGDPMTFVSRPISLTLLLLTLAVLVVLFLPNIRRKREEVFVED